VVQWLQPGMVGFLVSASFTVLETLTW